MPGFYVNYYVTDGERKMSETMVPRSWRTWLTTWRSLSRLSLQVGKRPNRWKITFASALLIFFSLVSILGSWSHSGTIKNILLICTLSGEHPGYIGHDGCFGCWDLCGSQWCAGKCLGLHWRCYCCHRHHRLSDKHHSFHQYHPQHHHQETRGRKDSPTLRRIASLQMTRVTPIEELPTPLIAEGQIRNCDNLFVSWESTSKIIPCLGVILCCASIKHHKIIFQPKSVSSRKDFKDLPILDLHSTTRPQLWSWRWSKPQVCPPHLDMICTSSINLSNVDNREILF